MHSSSGRPSDHYAARHRQVASRWRRLRVPLALLGLLLFSTTSAVAGIDGDPSTSSGRTVLQVPVAEDTYASVPAADTVKGAAVKLVASAVPGNLKTTYVKFTVSGLTSSVSDIHAVVQLTRDDHHLPGPVTLHQVIDSNWSERTLTARTAPALGQAIVTVPTNYDTRTVSFDIGRTVVGNGTYSFAVTSSSTTSVASFRSKESGIKPPKMVLDYQPGAGSGSYSPTPTPVVTTSPTPKPSPSPTATATASPSQTASSPPPPPSGTTVRMGATAGGGSAFDALNAHFPAGGKLQSERIYTSSVPATFAGSRAETAAKAGRVVWWSAKPSPATVASGSLDAQIRSLLSSVPTAGPDFYVTFWHEPEDNIRDGQFTHAQWKAANNRLCQLADAQAKPRLKCYLSLMGPWTFSPNSAYSAWDWNNGLDWKSIDAVGADPYYDYLGDRHTEQTMPGFMAWARSHGKPVALTEWGINANNPEALKVEFVQRTWAWANAQRDVIDLMYFVYGAELPLSTATRDALIAACDP